MTESWEVSRDIYDMEGLEYIFKPNQAKCSADNTEQQNIERQSQSRV